MSIDQRKADHIRINLEENVGFPTLTTGLEHFRFTHQALPELNLNEVDTTVTLFGKRLMAPILVSSMTGGTADAERINRNLAAAAEQYGLAMGVGSQRAGLENKATATTFRVRSVAPTVLLFANIGAVQLNYGYGVDACRQAVEMIEADALILHLNPLQEAVQAGGDTNWRGLLPKIAEVCRKLAVPVIAKEVGWGISTKTARQLIEVGVRAIDVAGAGGTSWSQVEMHRAPQLDRQHRFDELLLVGNPSRFRPLMEHLVETKDFRPTYVDHWAILFRRDPERAWKAEDLAPVRAALSKLSEEEQAAALAEVAVRLSAFRRVEEARALLDEAEKLDAGSPTMWNGRGVVHAQRGEWKEALACADRALKGGLEPLSAVATKTQALYAMKQFGPAYELSAQLVKAVPEDPGILFFHAKIAHEARAYRAEIAALEKLIAMAEAARRPVSGYCVYLGQAYASVSEAKRAVAAFARALEDPELPKDQRDFAEENIRRIRSRTDA